MHFGEMSLQKLMSEVGANTEPLQSSTGQETEGTISFLVEQVLHFLFSIVVMMLIMVGVLGTCAKLTI